MPATEKPRYVQLSDDLRARIQKGEWEVGDRLPSFTEMYSEHGASTTTMQRVYDVLEKEGFVERRSRSGIYITNPMPAQTGMLTFVIPEGDGTEHYASSSYSMKLLHGAHQEAASRGYQLALCTIKQLRTSDYPFNGCIVQGHLQLIQDCARFGKPVISLITEQSEAPTVGTDDLAGFKAITHHLLHLGHQRIAIIIDTGENLATYPTRLRGYCEAFAEDGIPLLKKWQRRLHGYGEQRDYASYGYLEMRQWLREDWAKLGCTAIVTQNDSTAIGVIKALRQHGYRVPQDISVTGYDDSGEDVHFDLKLTTVHVPLEDIAQRAVQLLDQLLQHPSKNTRRINLPTYVVIGESAAKFEGGNL